MRDVRIGVEADRLAVAARYCDEVWVVVLERLEQRLGGAPQRAAAANPRIVGRRHGDLGLIEPPLLQPPPRRHGGQGFPPPPAKGQMDTADAPPHSPFL